MRSDASLLAKISFVGAWLGVLAVVWIFGALMGWLPDPLSQLSSLWLPMYATLAALGVVSVILGLFALSLGERKWAIGGIIGGALVIVREGLFIWLVMTALQGLRF
jgi:hypothetical protein